MVFGFMIFTRIWLVPMCTGPKFRTSPKSWFSCWSNLQLRFSCQQEESSSKSWKQTCIWLSFCDHLIAKSKLVKSPLQFSRKIAIRYLVACPWRGCVRSGRYREWFCRGSFWSLCWPSFASCPKHLEEYLSPIGVYLLG